MKFKKIMIICILLLAVLTIGAVSAEDASDSINGTSVNGTDQVQIKELVQDEDYEIWVPDEISEPESYGSAIVSVENMPCDAKGNISISVDGVDRYNRKALALCNGLSLHDLDLDYGNHSLAIKYSGDDKYAGFLKNYSFEKSYLLISCPDEFLTSEGECSLDVYLCSGVTGNINILIDNKSVYDKRYDAGKPPSVSLNKYIGHHTYEVRYYNGNQKDLIKKGSFDGSIFNEPYISGYYDDAIAYGDSVRFEMELPYGSSGVARLNNKQYPFKSDDWYTYITINDFDVGENIVEVTVNYGGSTQTRNCSVLVLPKITLPSVLLVNESYDLTFNASDDCSGDLVLSGMINATFNVTNGKATVPISSMNLGNNTLNVSYGNYTWSYDIPVLEESPEVFIEFVYNDLIRPWDADYDCDPDHEDFLYYIDVTANPYMLTGNTEIYLDGKLNKTVSGVVSRYHLWPDYYAFGNHTIKVAYLGDKTFKPTTKTFNYTVAPYSCSISDHGVVGIMLPADVSGVLTVKANGKTQTKKVSTDEYYSDAFYFQLDGLKKDVNYTIDVSFKANQPKYSFTQSLNFAVSCPIYLGNNWHVYGESTGFIFFMPKDIKNKVSVTIDGNSYGYAKANGDIDDEYWFDEETQVAYEVNIADLKPGIHEVVISYPGDSKYPSNSTNATLNISAEFNWAKDDDGYSIQDMFSIRLPNDANGSVIVETSPDGLNYTISEIVELKDGKATVKMPVGRYYYRIYYSGNDCDVTEVKSYDIFYPVVNYVTSMNYGTDYMLKVYDDLNGTLLFYVGWYEGDRLPVAWFDLAQNKSISINKKLVDEILKNSKARRTLEQSYEEEGYYSLDLQVAIFSDVATFNLDSICLHFTPKITGAKNVNMLYSASKTVSLKVYDIYGKLVGKNEVVKIKIGKKTFSVKTDKNGAIKFKIPNTIVPGKYTMTVTYKNAKVSKKLTVKQILTVKTVKVKKSAKKLVLTATLKKVNGKYIKKKTVIFKFNGKTYKVKTNKKGVAKVTIKKSVLKKLKVGKKVKYQATYLKTTVKKTAKVKR